LFFGPQIYALISGLGPDEEELKQTEVVLVQPPPLNPDIPPPVNVEPPPPKNDQKKFPPPEVKPDEQVRDEEPPKLEELKKADPGQKTLEGDPDAEIVIAAPVGEGPKQAVVVEDNKVYDYVNIEVLPAYPGGEAAFREYIRKSVKYPPLAMETNLQGTVYVGFTVEKDGSLTNVVVERKVGGGLDEEAMRVVRASKRWTPGIQNGRPVRVKYNVPVKFSLQ
ncbi:MAG: energy transducer TonB, partial [Pedobacter sp.]